MGNKLRRRVGPALRSLVALAVYASAFSSLPVFFLPKVLSSPTEVYVFYAYIPPSVANMSKPIVIVTGVKDTITGTVYNYTSFPSYLDLVGVEDGTSYQVFDLNTKALLRSGSLSKYEHVRVPFGSRKTDTKQFEVDDYYIKLVTDKPVSALVWGGFIWGIPGFDRPYPENKTINGFSSFVPSVDGGFIGREFIFLTFPTYWEPKSNVQEFNCFNIFALQDSKVRVYNSVGDTVQEMDVGKLSMVRTTRLEPWNVYRIASTGYTMVFGTTPNSMTYAPCLTGGYVGRDFFATWPGSLWMGDLQSFIAVALQDVKVELYDMKKPVGSPPEKALDIGQSEMAFDISLSANTPVRVRSTGNITLLSGGNGFGWGTTYTSPYGYVTPQNIAEDIALLGARAGQEIGFYAPSQAIIFACGDTDVEVNGIPRHMRKDEFIRLASGMYTAKSSNAPMIIEVLGDTNVVIVLTSSQASKGFNDWGAYLVAPPALYNSYPPVELGTGMDPYLYVAVAAVAAAAVVAALLVVRSRRKV